MSIDVLSRAGQAALQTFIADGVALAFDYDGTLAPLVANPHRAFLRPRTRLLLKKLAPALLLTGRSVANARRLTRGIGFSLLIGSHGAEWSDHGHDAPPLDPQWRKALHAEATRFEGVFFEDKGQSLAIHYRLVASPADRRALARLVHAQRHVRVVKGKSVYNLVPKHALDKGRALRLARKELGVQRVIFLGDDITDEDVFALPDRWLMGIRVGARRASPARYHLRTQEDIDTLLDLLLQATRNK